MTTNIEVPRVTRVDALTDEQRARMPEWVERWVRIGLATTEGETDEERDARHARAEAAVDVYYRAANLEPPARKVWVSSPLAGAFAFPASALILPARRHASVRDSVGASVGDSFGASVRDSVRDSVGASIGASVRDSVGASVRASVDASVRDSVGASVDASVGDSFGASVGASVRDSVRASVDASVRDSVRASVGASVDASVGASVRDSVRDSVDASVGASVGADPKVLAAYRETLLGTWWRFLGGQFWAGYGWGWWASPSMLSYLRDVCGLDLGDRQPLADAVIALAESSCWVWPHRGFVMLCERPRVVARDDRGRLHREDGPAAEWGDGWGVYAWHGVRVPTDIILHPERITAERITAEQNAEVRRVLLERFAALHADGLAEALGAKVLDADLDQYERPRRLLSIAPRPGTDDEPIVMIELRNATLEPDGSRKTYVLRCDPQLRPLRARGERGQAQKMTCQNAVASLVGLTGAEYAPEVET